MLQEKLHKLKKKNKNQHEMPKKVRKMNTKLYWNNVVLKTNLKHEKYKFQSSAQQSKFPGYDSTYIFYLSHQGS
jgi:hypothetical protein